MLGKFVYSNPTKLYFGENSLENLPQELACYGKNVMLVYGGGSIKKNGIYENVVKLLRVSGKTVFEDAGVMPNPTLEKLYEGCRIAKENKVDLILAVGGGSVCDYAKAVSVSAYCETDPWEKYYLRMEAVDNKIIPVGCVLTMVGTGSEMNGGSVITNHAAKAKIGRVFGDNVFPRFSILDPTYTFTLPRYQMVAGFFDIMSHILEQYFSGTDDNTSDYLMEGLLRSLIHSSRIAVQSPEDYEARSNIMWTATWALNTLVACGKSTDWMVHMLGQAVGGYTNATHGMTLAAVSLPYYRHIMPYGLEKFKRFAVNVWGVDASEKEDREIAEEGLAAMESWMKELGLVMNLSELGVTEEMIEGIADVTIVFDGKVIVGTRAKKERAKSYNAFSSINFPYVAVIHDDHIIFYLDDKDHVTGPAVFYHHLDSKVALLKLIPSMDAGVLDYMAEHYDAVIIESFGVGGIPARETGDFHSAIERLVRSGKTLVMTTQVTNEGSNMSVYEIGKNIKQEFGLLEAYDMTLEASVTKMMWALGQTRDMEKFKELFYTTINHDLLFL